MNTNKVTLATVEEIQAATAALNGLREKMTFVCPLTPDQRRQAGKLGTKTVQTTALRLEAARQHREALPAAFDLREFERQTALLLAIHACVNASAQVHADLRDTLLALGARAVQTGKQAYVHIQAVAEASNKIGHTVKSLKLRNSPRRGKEPAPTPTTGNSAPAAAPDTPPPAETKNAA